VAESEYDILDGAEPFSAAGGPHGALVVHGFTGSPQSLRGLAKAFASAGFAVELPRLPGHGTHVDDMATTTWEDWSATTDRAYEELAARCDRVVAAGLSMGGTLTLWLASRHPEIAGIVLVNAFADAAPTAEMRAGVRAALDAGTTILPGVGGDIALPGATELAYDELPARGFLSLLDAAEELAPKLGEIRMPALVVHSLQDHVVARDSRDLLERSLGGPVEILELERSYHVATLDYDKDEIERRAVEFALRVVES
jgi:carboxylesterase